MEPMHIFTKDDLIEIKKRMEENPSYLSGIIVDTKDVMQRLYIQTDGKGTWYHYFTCPHCGTRLTFDYYNNESFHCPNCKSVQTGEPYLGAWWEAVLTKTTDAAYKLALAYVGTDNKEYLHRAREILLGYADNYKNYEVHGGIPYNKPGRFLSQVLSDCEPIWNLSRTYSLLKNDLTNSEREHIELDLLKPAAEHQMANLTPQLHNHEVAICASIASVAVATCDEELLNFALNEKYGLKYQFDHSFFDDDFWFEGSSSYHQYALFWFAVYETVARNTGYSLLRDKHYSEKLLSASLFFKRLHVDGGRSVKLNDGNPFIGNPLTYEILYAHFRDSRLLPLLLAAHGSYENRESSLSALVYGVHKIDDNIQPLEKETYLSKNGSNLAILRGSEKRYLCFKASPFAGEHDHYDRLSLSFDAFGRNACMDFGTAAGYGSPYHYSYFKNTATHNTVVIGGENMAPCDSRVNEYRYTSDDDIYLDARTLPPEDYTMPDTFTLKQWSDGAYRGVKMRRVISWHDKYFIDVFYVESNNDLDKDWTWHVDAEAILPASARYIGRIADKGAQSYLKNGYSLSANGILKCEYVKDDFRLDIHAFTDGRELIFAEGPGNPTDRTVSYLLERTNEKCPVYVNVIEAHRNDAVIKAVDVQIKNKTVSVTVSEKCGKARSLCVAL